MNGDGLVRVRVCRDYALRDDSQGVTLGHGSVVAVPEALAAEWLARGWVEPVVEAPA